MFFVINGSNELVGVYPSLPGARSHSFPGDRVVFVSNDHLAAGSLQFVLHSDHVGLTPTDEGPEEIGAPGFTPEELSELVEIQEAEIEELYRRICTLEETVFGEEQPLLEVDAGLLEDDGHEWN